MPVLDASRVERLTTRRRGGDVYRLVMEFEENVADDFDDSQPALDALAALLDQRHPGLFRKGWLKTKPGRWQLFQLLKIRDDHTQLVELEDYPAEGPPGYDGPTSGYGAQYAMYEHWKDHYECELEEKLRRAVWMSRGKR